MKTSLQINFRVDIIALIFCLSSVFVFVVFVFFLWKTLIAPIKTFVKGIINQEIDFGLNSIFFFHT